MGLTRSGRPYVPDLPPHAPAAPGFSSHVFSPPIVFMQRVSSSGPRTIPTTFADSVWGPGKTKARRLIELVAEQLTVTGSRASNGGATAAVFLAHLSQVSRELSKLARDNALWGPLVTLSFGEDAACSLPCRLPKRGPTMFHSIFGKLARTFRDRPSLFFDCLMITRDDPSDPQAMEGRALPYIRSLTLEERSRVALWTKRCKLVDDMGDSFEIAKPGKGPHISQLDISKALAQSHRMTRELEIVAPPGEPCITVDSLLAALAAFEHGWQTHPDGAVELLERLLTAVSVSSPQPTCLACAGKHRAHTCSLALSTDSLTESAGCSCFVPVWKTAAAVVKEISEAS